MMRPAAAICRRRPNSSMRSCLSWKSVSTKPENGQEAPRLLKQEVRPDDVADIVARWTGIPVTRLLQSERDKLIHLPDKLHERVIGQDEAVQAVSDAVLRTRAGLSDPSRPQGLVHFPRPDRVWARRSCARPWPKRSLTAKRTSCAST